MVLLKKKMRHYHNVIIDNCYMSKSKKKNNVSGKKLTRRQILYQLVGCWFGPVPPFRAPGVADVHQRPHGPEEGQNGTDDTEDDVEDAPTAVRILVGF